MQFNISLLLKTILTSDGKKCVLYTELSDSEEHQDNMEVLGAEAISSSSCAPVVRLVCFL